MEPIKTTERPPATTSVERPHHPYSPSKLQYLEACPRYVSKNNASEASEAGTRQHAAVEAGRVESWMADGEAQAVAQCLDFRDQLIEQFPGGTVIAEEYLPIDDELIEHGGIKWKGTSAGYLDFGVVSADQTKCAIIDYKFGARAVEDAENNLQGFAYLLGLVKRFPKIRSAKIHFLMPKRDEISAAESTDAAFDSMMLRIRTVVSRARDPKSQENANVGTCLFCARIGECAAVHRLVLNIGKKFAPTVVPENVSPLVLSDPKETALGMKIAGIVKTWAEAYRQQATSKAVEDDFVPEGYELSLVSRREVKSVTKLRDIALLHVDAAVVDAATDIALTPIEKAVAANAPRGSKEKSVEKFQQLLLDAGAVEKGKPYPVLKLAK